MAMKFVNTRASLLALSMLITLLGCSTGSQQKKANSAANKNIPLRLVDTSRYIPQPQMNQETGQLIPYQTAANPYLTQTGRIEASLVNDFIAARQAYQKGWYKKATEALTRLTRKTSTLSGPWLMLADIAKKQQRSEQAIKHYTKAIKVNKGNVNAYIRLAKLQREQGNFIAAQNTYKDALAVWKDFPEAHLNLAILYDIYLNKPLKSQRHLEAYLFLINGRDKKRRLWLKEIQQRTGKPIQLKVEIRKAISAKSD